MSASAPAKPGRKPNSRAQLDALLRTSKEWEDACARAAAEKRPVEFVVPPRMVSPFDPIASALLEPQVRWAWPDGTVTSPMSLRQRMRDQLHGRARHGETLPTTASEIVERHQKKITPPTYGAFAHLLQRRNHPA